MKTIAIIGHGYVGKSTEQFFKDKVEILIYDIANTGGEAMKDKINKDADLAIVCVPTPSSDDGSVDISSVEESVEWLKAPLILIKSTVPPGTVRRLAEKSGKHIAFSPEFVGEGNYEIPYWDGLPHPTDMRKHHYIVVGSPEQKTADSVMEFFKPIMGPFCQFHSTDAETAELMKYVINSYLATMVTFFNEISDIAENHNVSYTRLRELVLLDKRISRTHSLVFDDNRGFGGKCLPKDVKGIVSFSKTLGYDAELLKSVLSVNEKMHDKNSKDK